MVIAHRGGSELFTENTMTAFRKAEGLGVDAIECDIHLTRDGKPVVIHDPDLKRIAGIDKLVSDLTFKEISEIRLPGEERIPALEEVWNEISTPLVVELKSADTIASVATILKQHPEYVKKCVIISFYHLALLLLRKEFPDLMTGALLAGFPVDPVSVAKSCGAGTISLYYEGVNREYVDLCHSGGIQVSVWTPNTESDIRDMIDAGVDAIASDRPDLVLKALARR